MPKGRPKGSKNTVQGHKNHNLAKREKRWEFVSEESLKKYQDEKSTPDEKAKAWAEHLRAEEHLTSIGLARNQLKVKETIHRKPAPASVDNDPMPTSIVTGFRDREAEEKYAREFAAWKSRHPEYKEPAPPVQQEHRYNDPPTPIASTSATVVPPATKPASPITIIPPAEPVDWRAEMLKDLRPTGLDDIGADYDF